MKKFILIFLLFSSQVFAGKYPVITSLSAEPYAGDYVYVTTTQSIMEIGPASEQIVPAGGWYVGLVYKLWDHGVANLVPWDGEYMQHADGTQTIGALALASYDSGASHPQASLTFEPNPDEPVCVGYMAILNYGGEFSTWENRIAPTGCMVVPPVNEWCQITTPEIILDHGTLTLKDAEGSKASQMVNIHCTSETQVTFNLTGDNFVYLDDGKSEISVDESPLDSVISLPKGDSQVKVTDKLTGVTTEGFHTGSSILVMSPY